MQYTKRRQLDAMDRALFNHYRANPELLEEHRKRSVIESLLSAGIGAGLTKVYRGNPSNTWGFLPLAIGATAGVTAGYLGNAARRRRALYEQGIDTNLIGSFAKPFNEKGEDYFN